MWQLEGHHYLTVNYSQNIYRKWGQKDRAMLRYVIRKDWFCSSLINHLHVMLHPGGHEVPSGLCPVLRGFIWAVLGMARSLDQEKMSSMSCILKQGLVWAGLSNSLQEPPLPQQQNPKS